MCDAVNTVTSFHHNLSVKIINTETPEIILKFEQSGLSIQQMQKEWKTV